MKTNIKLKDFLDKETLQKTLETKIKKALMFLAKNPSTPLPFQYESGYFDDGTPFFSVGIAKEIHSVFKKQRSKGQGKDENGKIVKIDKKKVAYGQVTFNGEGVYEFLVEGGTLKRALLKKDLTLLPIVKKVIGSNFAILDKAPLADQAEETITDTEASTDPATTAPNEETTETATTDDTAVQKNRARRQAKKDKVQQGADKLGSAIGRTDASQINAGIEKLQAALTELEKEAAADGEVDEQEQAQIDTLKAKIQGIQEHQQRLGDRKIKMTPKNRQVVNDKLTQARAYLEKVKAAMTEAAS